VGAVQGQAQSQERELLEIAPRLRQRCVARGYIAGAEGLLAVLEDASGVLAGTSAARQLGWQLPDGDWPVELYVPEGALVDVIEAHALEMVRKEAVDVVLRPCPIRDHSRRTGAWCPRSSPRSIWLSRSPLLSSSWAAGV
jgi:hypothetical protein